MRQEAARAHPHETGGMLLGWNNKERNEIVVAASIGPGPKAGHTRASFRPDGAWQQVELERMYSRTDGKLTFLGDWHVHPAGGPAMSRRDRKTLAHVARTPEARCSTPVTVLLARAPDDTYCVGAWMRRRRWSLLARRTMELDVTQWETTSAERFWE